VGYNVKLTSALIGGVEVQLAHASATESESAGPQSAASVFFIPADTFTVDAGRLTSIRGRVGTAMTRDLFLYGTIGVAMTKVTASGVFPAIGSFQAASGSESHTMKGLTIGVGADYAPFHAGTLRQLTIGAEFRHASLGSQAFDFGDVDIFQPPPIIEPALGTITLSANEFDVRVNFRYPLKK
jgi:opacity protein-like surface antigen